jgi:hypothetical protein
MIYPYTASSRLDEPHNYMYAPFGGADFLRAYRQNRSAVLRRIAVGTVAGDAAYEVPVLACLKRLGWDGAQLGQATAQLLPLPTGSDPAANLARFSVAEPVDTSRLLEALLAAQLGAAGSEQVKVWLDRLVQRFEVTKKLHATYLPGFRKGDGVHTLVRLYWLLSLSLTLAYAVTRSLKYINTLLKVNDLLASLPSHLFAGHFSVELMTIVFEVELAGVYSLAEVGEKSYAT